MSILLRAYTSINREKVENLKNTKSVRNGYEKYY